jgi:hypothetical protein
MSVTFSSVPYRVELVAPHATKKDLTVALPDRTEYYLNLYNDSNRWVEARVNIGRDEAAHIQIEPCGTFKVNTKLGVGRQFTFVKVDGAEAQAAGVDPESQFNGVVEVNFIGEKATAVVKEVRVAPPSKSWAYGSLGAPPSRAVFNLSSNHHQRQPCFGPSDSTFGQSTGSLCYSPQQQSKEFGFGSQAPQQQAYAMPSQFTFGGTTTNSLYGNTPLDFFGAPKAGTTIYGARVNEPTYRSRAAITNPDPEYTKTIRFLLVEAVGVATS